MYFAKYVKVTSTYTSILHVFTDTSKPQVMGILPTDHPLATHPNTENTT